MFTTFSANANVYKYTKNPLELYIHETNKVSLNKQREGLTQESGCNKRYLSNRHS